jgi:hypothetical protein
MYGLDGMGGIDREQGLSWLQKSAAQGYQLARQQLQNLQAQGHKAPKANKPPKQQAKYQEQKLDVQAEIEQQHRLGNEAYVRGDLQGAMHHFNLEANYGSALGWESLGNTYLSLNNPIKAAECYHFAVLQGGGYGVLQLASLYWRGNGVNKNQQKTLDLLVLFLDNEKDPYENDMLKNMLAIDPRFAKVLHDAEALRRAR